MSFQHALRGIHGPDTDRDLLIFLAAYLCSPIANYFLFHTASSWGMAQPKVHVEEVLRLPFLRPEQQANPKRGREIVAEVARIVTSATKNARGDFADRKEIIHEATKNVEPLIEEYFDILYLEKLLIDDTIKVIIPSIQPKRLRMPVPTVRPSTSTQRQSYRDRICEMLNEWSKTGEYTVRGRECASEPLGIGMVVLEKVRRSEPIPPATDVDEDVLSALDRLSSVANRKNAALNPVRGIMVFDRNRLYISKSIGQRYWTQTAAMNDADEIAGTILMRSPQEDA